MSAALPADAIPPPLLDASVLGGLDAAARAQLAAASRVVELAPGATLFREGDDGDAFFLVWSGALGLHAVRRGDAAPSVLRVARAGDSVGEEALLGGLRRRSTAVAAEPTRALEIPIAVFRRLIARAGSAGLDREARYLERAALRDLLAASALGRELGPDDADLLVDGMRLERFERGAALYEAGDRASAGFVLVDGMVQLQREDAGRAAVVAYLGRGDLFGDEEAVIGVDRGGAAVASGESWCAVIPAALLRLVGDRNPGLLGRLRRVADTRSELHGGLVGAAAARSTQHVFRDLYRMQMARSLLVIDQDRCVRCGHCAWSCADTHGVSRLVRRGDKVVTGLAGGAGPASLLLPSTCQHCRHAACMTDCPTGAIARDPGGEVYIREALCTGCGNCAKSCPWDNIQMAARAGAPHGLSLDVAVKCDLCRGYEAPACVEACPTEALVRLDPSRDIGEVALILGVAAAAPAPPALPVPAPAMGVAEPLTRRAALAARAVTHRAMLLGCAGAIATLVAALGWAQQRRGAWSPSHGPGLAAGVVAALLLLGLAAYAVPKRLRRPARRQRSRGETAAALVGEPIDRRPLPRSRTRPQLLVHLGLGLVAPAAAFAHAGPRLSSTPGGALALALVAATVLGALGALAYRVLPARLTRLERRGGLPEDLAGEAEALMARLYREATGQNELVKAIAGRLLVPYARAPLGWLGLALSGRALADEEARVRGRVGEVLAGRGGDRTAGLEPLVRTAVELRALPARRAISTALRAWLPLHIVSAAIVLALLVAHVATAVLR